MRLRLLNRSASGSGYDLWRMEGEGESSAADDAGEGETFLLMESAVGSSDEVNLSHYGRIPGTGYCASQSAGGLICFDDKDGIHVANPATGDSVTLRLPMAGNLSTSHRDTSVLLEYDPVEKRYKILHAMVGNLPTPHKGTSVLGYDPVEKKYKVLCSTDGDVRILTLGQKEWRKVECGNIQFEEAMCIDGVLHIRCFADNDKYNNQSLLLFDVMRETFRVIPCDKWFWTDLLMAFVEFGRTSSVIRDCHVCDTDYGDPDFDVSVLEDPKNQLWSLKEIFMPSHLTATLKKSRLSELRFPRVSDILLVPRISSHIYAFNLEDSSVRRMKISELDQHFPTHRWRKSLAITKHVESLQSLQSFCID